MPIPPKADISPTRQVGVSATYMASDYDTDTAEASSGSQIYRVDLEVFEDSGAPAASLEMSLMAALVGDDTDGLDVTVNGVAVTLPTYSDSPAKNVTTDAHGRLTVEVDGSSSGALPQLVLIDDQSFLAYQTVISPDWQNISRLSTLQAGDLDGTAATAYDGTALIAPAFQDGPDGPNLTAIATGVRNTIGTTSPPAGGEDALGPTRMVRMSPDLVSDTSGGRPWQAGEIPSFTLTLDDSAISFTYPLESHSLDPQDGLFHDIKDFTEHVYKEGKKVLEIAWDAAEDAATATVRALIEGVEDAITFVVETVEDAATVVVGFLASVAQDVERVLEWLSYVFEWQDIVNTATLIVDSVTTAYQTFSTNLSGAVDDVVHHLDGAADQLKEDIGTALQPGGVVDQFLQSSLTGLQQTKQPPADVAGPLASSKSQTGWVAGRMTSGASAATLALPRDADAGLQAFESDLKSTFDTIKGLDSVKDLESDLTTLFTQIVQVVGDAESLMSEGLSGILDLFTGALDTANTFIDMVVDLLVAVVDAALELIAGVVAALVDILSVALPDIPIVSALFKTLTKQDMTALNLAALLVAIPTTIVYKAVAGQAPGEQSAAMAEVPWEKIAQIVKDLVEAIVEPIKDIVKSLPDGWIFAAMSAGLGLIGFGLGFSALIEKDDPATILYCVAGVVPILLTAAGFVLKKLGSAEAEPFASQAAPVISSGYGAVMMTMSAAYAAAFQGSYVDPDGLPLAAGVVGRLPALLAILPLITESLELSEQAGEAIVITASGVCPVIVALIEGAELAVDGAA